MATLTEAWTSASAALPLEWEIFGLAMRSRAPYEWGVAAAEDNEWIAAAGPSAGGSVIAGYGSYPGQALLNLAAELRRVRGETTGNVPSDEGL